MHAQKEENATASGGRARTGRAHHGLGLRRPRTATSGSGGVGRRRRQQPMAAASGDGSGGGQRNGGFGMAAKGARRCISSSLSFQCQVGALLDRRIVPYVLPVFLFVVLYSKLPHKELRFIIGSIPMLNVSTSLAASRLYNNRTKAGWNLLYVLMLGAFLVRYSKEEEISTEEYQKRNFTYLLNEHRYISGYKCLFAVDGFSRAKIRPRIPPLSGRYPQNLLQVKEPKVFAHGNMRYPDILSLDCPSCPLR